MNAIKTRSQRLEDARQHYEQVRKYFPVASERARALGVTRVTIDKWDEAWPSKMRESSLGKLDAVWRLCALVTDRLPSPSDVGKWVSTPQPQLDGRTPLDEVLERGHEALEDVRAYVLDHAPPRPSASRPLPSPEQFIAMVAEDLGPAAAARVRSAYEASLRSESPRRRTLV